MTRLNTLFFALLLTFCISYAAAGDEIRSGAIWPDVKGQHINAHGGGILQYKGQYYWFGEDKDPHTNNALIGFSCYRSDDLIKWTKLPTALSVDTTDAESPIARGCILERPKVIYNARTRRFVMWFHLELKGKGYAAAYAGVATAKKPEGPYKFIRASRVNAGQLPADMSESDIQRMRLLDDSNYQKWWTPEWRKAIAEGLFLRRDLEHGQMSRDMTLFVDTDGRAYHIYSSEDNLTLQIAELSDDYCSHTGRYIRVAPAGQNEAPCLLKHDGRYWLITSGCTGWNPNAARLFSAPSIMGPWTENLGNPCTGADNANITFGGQGTYVIPITAKGGTTRFIFMADIWRPNSPSDGRYLWLPIRFGQDGRPEIPWRETWSMSKFLSGAYD